MLKNSARNWAPKRSLNVQFFATEKSQSRKPESGKRLRPMVPKVPKAGGINTEPPFAKHPNACREGVPPIAAASFRQACGMLELPPAKYGIDVGPDLKSWGFP